MIASRGERPGKAVGRGFGLEALGENAGAFVGPIGTVLLLYTLQVDIRLIFYVAFVPALTRLRSFYSSSSSSPRQRSQAQASLYVHRSFRGVIGDSWLP